MATEWPPKEEIAREGWQHNGNLDANVVLTPHRYYFGKFLSAVSEQILAHISEFVFVIPRMSLALCLFAKLDSFLQSVGKIRGRDIFLWVAEVGCFGGV